MLKKVVVTLSFIVSILTMQQSFAVGEACHGRFLNPITDINWNLVFPIKVAGVPISGGGSNESPLAITSPVCVCPGHIFGIPTAGIMMTFHEPLYIEEVARNAGCMASIGGVSVMEGYHNEDTEHKEGKGSVSRWQIHWYQYPVFSILKLFQNLTCVSGGGFALGYMTEIDPTWQNDLWGSIMSPESVLFANPIAQAACIADAVSSTFQFPLDAEFWCAGTWGSVYPFTGNSNVDVGADQSAENVGAKFMAKLARVGMLWDTVGQWAMCSPVPNPIWVKSEFTIDPVYPMIRHGMGMPIGAAPAVYLNIPPQQYPSMENINQVIFQEQQCCIHV